MSQLRTRPRPAQLWLSRLPYPMIARIVDVDGGTDAEGTVSYVLYDEAGSVLEHVDRVALDGGFLHTFQPLTKRLG